MKRAAGICACVLLWANVSAGAGPVVFHVSDPVGPDETALLFGDGLSGVSVQGCVLPDEPVASPAGRFPAVAKNAWLPPGTAPGVGPVAKVLLPADWPRGTYLIGLQNAANATVAPLNRTEPWWWLGEPGDTAAPGGTIRVCGKNLGEKPAAWLGQQGQWIALAPLENDLPGAKGYQCRFALPGDLAPGQYELMVHNGHGGRAGFGRPLTVNVARSEPWPTRQFDVRAFGAAGDAIRPTTLRPLPPRWPRRPPRAGAWCMCRGGVTRSRASC